MVSFNVPVLLQGLRPVVIAMVQPLSELGLRHMGTPKWTLCHLQDGVQDGVLKIAFRTEIFLRLNYRLVI